MVGKILTLETAGISEFKKNPLTVLDHSQHQAITILHNNKPAFCCLSIRKYEELMKLDEQLDQFKLLLIQSSLDKAQIQDENGSLTNSEDFFKTLLSGDFD